MGRGPIGLECRETSSKILVYERGHTRVNRDSRCGAFPPPSWRWAVTSLSLYQRTTSRKQRWRTTDYSRKGSMNRQHLTFLFEHHTKLLVKTRPPRGPLPVRCKRLRITCGSSRPSESALGRKSLSRFPPSQVKPSRALSRASTTRLTRRRAQCRSSWM
jgi:hypothetical protein